MTSGKGGSRPLLKNITSFVNSPILLVEAVSLAKTISLKKNSSQKQKVSNLQPQGQLLQRCQTFLCKTFITFLAFSLSWMATSLSLINFIKECVSAKYEFTLRNSIFPREALFINYKLKTSSLSFTQPHLSILFLPKKESLYL